MDISYLGHSSFLIKSKQARLVTDPYDSSYVGLTFPKTECDVVTMSHQHKDHNAMEKIGDTPLVIDWPGEFEKNGMRITGFLTYHDDKKGADHGENIMYRIDDEHLTLLHCGDLGVVPSSEIINKVGSVDILFVPVGGRYTLDAAAAVAMVKAIEPTIIIPMHYRTDAHGIGFADIETAEPFIQKLGLPPEMVTGKYTVKKEDMQEAMKLVIFQ